MEQDIIKHSDVKTMRQFEIICDRYYHRAHRLRAIWQDENESGQRRDRAFKAWIPLFVLVPQLAVEYSNMQMLAITASQKEAGILAKVRSGESIINKKTIK